MVNSPLEKKLITWTSTPLTFVATHLKNAEGASLGILRVLLPVATSTPGEITIFALVEMSSQLLLSGVHFGFWIKHPPLWRCHEMFGNGLDLFTWQESSFVIQKDLTLSKVGRAVRQIKIKRYLILVRNNYKNWVILQELIESAFKRVPTCN